MATNQEKTNATRSKLISVARHHFATNGYENTLTSDILAQTGLSRGALYHHFSSKRALFEEVFIATSEEAVKLALESGKGRDSPLDKLTSACLAWLSVVRDPDFASIILELGPQVLGWKQARALESKAGLGAMIVSLEQAVTAGDVAVSSVELTASMLNAVLAEVALANLYSATSASAAEQDAAVKQFIDGLRK